MYDKKQYKSKLLNVFFYNFKNKKNRAIYNTASNQTKIKTNESSFNIENSKFEP